MGSREFYQCRLAALQQGVNRLRGDAVITDGLFNEYFRDRTFREQSVCTLQGFCSHFMLRVSGDHPGVDFANPLFKLLGTRNAVPLFLDGEFRTVPFKHIPFSLQNSDCCRQLLPNSNQIIE